MNKIHPLSQITTLPDFDLFTVPPTQLTIEKNYVTEHRPISTLNPTSIIEFNVNSSVDEYIQLKDTMFYIKIRMDIKKAAGGNVDAADWAKCQFVNNLLHSLFRSIDLEIEGKTVTQTPQTYAYKAYFETLFGYTEEAKVGYLTSSFWYNDDDKKNAISQVPVGWIKPTVIKNTGEGKSIELLGKLHLDLCFQPRALIGGTKLKFTFIPNDKNFYVWHDTSITSTVEFEKAALYVSRSKLSYPVVEAHNLAIAKSPAKYPIMRSNVKAFTVVANQLNVNIDNAITGQIPRRMFLAMVDSRAFNGSHEYNPFKFDHNDLNYLAVTVDGVQYPSIPFTPDFTNNLYAREFMSVYECLNQLHSEPTFTITKDEYKTGNVMFGFTFSPDPTDDCNKVGYVNPIRYGAVNINMRFSTALPNNINVLLYCEYDNIIQIDATRQPMLDYF